MPWRVIEEGVVPSLPLGRVKAALRIHHDADDSMLRHFIQVARQTIEQFTQKVLGDVRLEITLDRWEPSKHPWSGLTQDKSAPTTWITLPVGPLHALETISVRRGAGEWQDLSPHRFIVEDCRLGVCGEMHGLIQDQHTLRIVGRGGINPLPPIIDGVWMSLVRLLYDSDTPEVRLVRGALAPLNFLRTRRLM